MAGLAARTAADVWIPHYVPGPGATVDEALPLLDALAVEVAQAAGKHRVGVAGDSAGGNIARASTR